MDGISAVKMRKLWESGVWAVMEVPSLFGAKSDGPWVVLLADRVQLPATAR
jgi:hypothetical protein